MIAAIALGLTVSAAVSLRAPLEEIGADWERLGHPPVALNTAASGLLLAQIEKGAPIDVYISASSTEVDRLAKAGAVAAGSRRTVAGNRLVVVVPRGGSVPTTIPALADDLFDRVAIGNPETVPAGRYAREALRSAGIWDRIAPRLVFAENARQVLDWVARGEAAAGIVYRTDVALAGAKVVAGPEAPAGSHAPIVYEGCAVAGEREEEAKAFLAFLGSREGAAILAKHGFEPPGR